MRPCWKEIACPPGLLIIICGVLTPYNFAMCARREANNHGVKVNDLGSNPDCDNCQKTPRIKQAQSMVVNVKLVALDNLQAASIPQSSEPNENKGESMRAALAAYSDACAQLR